MKPIHPFITANLDALRPLLIEYVIDADEPMSRLDDFAVDVANCADVAEFTDDDLDDLVAIVVPYFADIILAVAVSNAVSFRTASTSLDRMNRAADAMSRLIVPELH